MLIILGILLAIGWILGFTVMKVSSVGIHVLLLLALVSIVFHFFRADARNRVDVKGRSERGPPT